MQTYESEQVAVNEMHGILDARDVPRGEPRNRIIKRAVRYDGSRGTIKPFWHHVTEQALQRIIAEETERE